MNVIVSPFLWLATLLSMATIAFAALFFLRSVLKWMNVNPFGRIPYHLTRITEPMVRPVRSQLGGLTFRFDLVPFITGIMILIVGLVSAGLLAQFGVVFGGLAEIVSDGLVLSRAMIAQLVRLAGLLLVIAVWVRMLLPYFNIGYSNRLFRFLFKITEPVLAPLRRFCILGMFDFSPLIVMLVVPILTKLLANAIAGIGSVGLVD